MKDLDSTRIDALKGILILVIVIGHNDGLMANALGVRQLFYYFNVQCFFFLSFVLPGKPFSLPFLRDRAVRYLAPYLWFVTFSGALFGLMNSFIGGQAPTAANFLHAVYSGDETILNEAVGLRLFWFLPTLFSLVVLRAFWLRWEFSRWVISILATVCLAIGPWFPSSVQQWQPLGLLVALFFFVPCLIVRKLFHNSLNFAFEIGAWVLSFLLGAWILWQPLGWVAASSISTYANDVRTWSTLIAGLCFPVTVFFMLYSCTRFLNGQQWLVACGRYSLVIYLVHVFAYRVLTILCYGRDFQKVQVVSEKPMLAAVLLLLTIVMSLAVALIIARFKRLNQLLFPRNYQDLCAGVRGSSKA